MFFNLLGNALKFTPEGGRVTVAVAPTTETVEVRVTDTGLASTPASCRICSRRSARPRASTPRRYGGAGLGLSIAKELVEAHKGRIAAESAGIGRGATFIVTLPVAQSYSQEYANRRSSCSAC